MVCKACGRSTANENANFCEYCGYSFRENKNIQSVQESYPAGGLRQESFLNVPEKAEKEVSFKNWIGTMLLPVIPVIGIFVYLVMLFVWAFGNETPKSKKNWARATLVVLAISILVVVVFMTSAITDFMNSGMTVEQFMNKKYY